MSKRVRWVVMAAALAVFLAAACKILLTMRQYQQERKIYEQAAEKYTVFALPAEGAGHDREELPGDISEEDMKTGLKADMPQIMVDFESLLAVNSDIVGWIYCEGTVINYPVLQADDNEFYLHRSYDRSYLGAGSIFVDAHNRRDFEDANTIIYGHHMKDNSMFATLEYWADPEYCTAHPMMWLLTPGQDYKLLLLGGYTTHAGSDAYRIFEEAGEELEEYLEQCLARADFRTNVALDGQGKYVVLSTCSYEYEDARYVLFGMLVPVGSAGGTPFLQEE